MNEYSSATGAAVGIGVVLFMLIIWLIAIGFIIAMIVGMWKIFEKADRPGWASLIPFYNTYVLTDIATGKGLLMLIMLIPCANFIFLMYLDYKLSQAFGGGIGLCLLLIFLPFIGFPMLGFGDYQYYPPAEDSYNDQY